MRRALQAKEKHELVLCFSSVLLCTYTLCCTIDAYTRDGATDVNVGDDNEGDYSNDADNVDTTSKDNNNRDDDDNREHQNNSNAQAISSKNKASSATGKRKSQVLLQMLQLMTSCEHMHIDSINMAARAHDEIADLLVCATTLFQAGGSTTLTRHMSGKAYTNKLKGQTPGDALLRERSEPKQHQLQTHAEEYCGSVNDECECPGTQCGDVFKKALMELREISLEDCNSEIIRKKWNDLLRNMRPNWPDDSPHWHQDSPTCNLINMPREVLPRLRDQSYASPDKWPYCSQSIIDDVTAMRFIRVKAATPSAADMWQILQKRLKQYADSGTGSIAEAIVYNDCYWTGQLAHEPPSGA
eukprot:14603-Heterococcus_DN1.PRE.2